MASPDRLRVQWAQLAREGLTNRAIAARLGVSEAALVACGSRAVSTQLRADASELLGRTRELGSVKWVVRNDHAVLERTGTLQDIALRDGTLVASGDTFVLRVASESCTSAFLLEERRPDGALKRSVQLFDAEGTTLVKIVLREDSSLRAFARMARDLADAAPCRDARGTQAPHASHAGGEPASLAAFLEAAAHAGVPLQLRVANAGASLEAVTAIQRVRRSTRAPWINVLDPGIDLHLHEQVLTRVRAEPRGEGGRFCWLAGHSGCALSVDVEAAFAHLYAAANRLPECEQAG